MTSVRRSIASLALPWLLMTSCVAPAFTTSQYQAKVVSTSESVVSSIETVRLALDLMGRYGLPKGPVDVTVSAQEDIVKSVAGSFSLAQPPNDASIELRDQVLELLDEAQAMVEDARIALRQGEVQEAIIAIEAAEDVSKKLDEIATRFSGG
ncbi:MAG: hypothetical protein QOG04_1202 [Actinomycetota bacterium]|jgi:phosphate uptake regulator|nr:hypothetical protein [Actinomycetota bacterium]